MFHFAVTTIKLFQIVAAVITVVLFLIRRKCSQASVCLAKTNSTEGFCGDAPIKSRSHQSQSYMVLSPRFEWASYGSNPKYKRDPPISVDNEDIDYRPLD